MASVAPDRLVFLDETAALTNLVRLRARSPRGERACGTAPCGRWERLTVPGALAAGGIVGAMTIEAATDGAIFAAFLSRVLLPRLRDERPDAVLVLDNLSAHKARGVRELLDGSGFACRHPPPYSPDLNPIEPVWAKVKARLRTEGARAAEALHGAVGRALDGITPSDARGFFRHAGYEAVAT